MELPSKMTNRSPAEELRVYRRCQSVPCGCTDEGVFYYKPENFRSCTVDRVGPERQRQTMEEKFKTWKPLQHVRRSRSRTRRIRHVLCRKSGYLVWSSLWPTRRARAPPRYLNTRAPKINKQPPETKEHSAPQTDQHQQQKQAEHENDSKASLY
ncbi:unnamed protein product [Gongylonema pulchrum]|uniref:Expressed conserved protein n=1 Tax=Gongylonema pulchrum TaxID=637853 RepID=A0A183CXZ0_9BILA|nr:unnamed protein product [Gongylonema pulchrum]